jgi:UDP-glucose 4-epimerase
MVIGDLLDGDALENAMEGMDHVFHLAGFADLNRARNRPLETAQLNVIGTVRCLEAALAAGVERLVFSSSVYVYSREGGFYRCSKQACEAYIEEFQRQFGLDYTILRFGSLYGPRADESNGVYRLLRQAALSGQVRHTGTADDVREYIHVQDAARLGTDATSPAFRNQHLIITGHHPMRVKDLFTMFSEILGRELDVRYLDPPQHGRDGHYRVTPYAYTPRVGLKLTSNCYVDMGQGILQILDEMRPDEASFHGFMPPEAART